MSDMTARVTASDRYFHVEGYERIAYDLVYVDGHHSFDYVLLDFFYADQLLGAGGVVGFNDCGWPSVSELRNRGCLLPCDRPALRSAGACRPRSH